MSSVINRGYHPYTDQYFYWKSPTYDPNGDEYDRTTPPFSEISKVVIVQQIPTGDLDDELFYDDLSDQADGSTGTFELEFEPFQDYVDLFLNGLRQIEGTDWEFDSNGDIRFIGFTPNSSDNVAALYFRT